MNERTNKQTSREHDSTFKFQSAVRKQRYFTNLHVFTLPTR